MRGAGCTLNDIADRDFDAKVARTRDAADPERRRLACAGRSLLSGHDWLVGLAILLSLDRLAILLGCVLALVARTTLS
jgi:4-hydroxybenzoate polyprenyltransferase